MKIDMTSSLDGWPISAPIGRTDLNVRTSEQTSNTTLFCFVTGVDKYRQTHSLTHAHTYPGAHTLTRLDRRTHVRTHFTASKLIRPFPSNRELKEMRRGRNYMRDIAEKNKIRVFTEIRDAVQSCIDIVKGNCSRNDQKLFPQSDLGEKFM